METANVVSALIGAVVAGIVALTPAIIRLLSGRAAFVQSDHQLVVAELKAENDRLTTRLDRRIADVDRLEERLVELTGHIGRCEAETAMLKTQLGRCEENEAALRQELRRLEQEVAVLRKTP